MNDTMNGGKEGAVQPSRLAVNVYDTAHHRRCSPSSLRDKFRHLCKSQSKWASPWDTKLTLSGTSVTARALLT